MFLISVIGAGRGEVSDRFRVDALFAGDDTAEAVGHSCRNQEIREPPKRLPLGHCAPANILITCPSTIKEALVAFCPTCGTQIADGASCPKCAAGAGPGASAAAPAAGGLADNVAGALAYMTIIPAIVFLVLEPFNKNKFVRFHAFQCIFFVIAWTVVWFALVFVPFLGWSMLLLWRLVGFVIWLILVLKAYQGQMFKLPVIGDIAAQQAGA
jgi:uncharacterized membrane protein